MSDVIDLVERRHRQKAEPVCSLSEAQEFLQREIDTGAKGVFVVAFRDDSYSWVSCGEALKADMAYCSARMAKLALDD